MKSKLFFLRNKRCAHTRYLLLLLMFIFSLDGSAQRNNTITINVRNKKFIDVINLVKSQTNKSFVYTLSDLPASENVSIDVKNGSINDVLNQLISNSGIKYEMTDKHIILSSVQKESKRNVVFAGIILDDLKEPLIGVNIVIKGSNKGTTTDIDGKFSIDAHIGDKLEVSYIGYTPQIIDVTSSKSVTIILKNESKLVDEVVVTALGIKRQEKSLSYNVQVLKSDQLNTSKDANFMNALSGKVAGVNINASAAGPGAATRVVMRGAKSIGGDNGALYVVDGIPIYNDNKGTTSGPFSLQPRGEGISDINPEDIESMSVLSGPAAAALYGSNAAQGVIIINTKKGKEGRVKVNVSNSTTFSKPFRMHEFQNTYANRPGEFKSWGEKGAYSEYDPSNFFNSGSNVQNTVSVSMGNEKNQTYLSVGSTNAHGIIINNKYNRYNFSFRNTTSFLNNKMLLDAGINYIIQNDQNMMAQGEYYNPLVAVYLYPRGENFDDVRAYEEYDEGRNISVQRWKWGTQGMSMQNPYWIAKRNIYGTKKERYMMNLALKYDVLEWLNISGRVRVDNGYSNYERQNFASTAELFAGKKGFYAFTKTEDKQLYADALVNINKNINDFSLSANLGTSISYASSDMAGAQGALKDMPNLFNFFNIDFVNGRDSYAKQVGWEEETQSLFFSGELGWRSMLYLTVTARNDWASALAKTEKSSFAYPSVGVSGVVTEMIKLPEFISYLKVRGSYASVGSAIPRHLSQPGYAFRPGVGNWETNTFRPLGKIFPERTNAWEVGLSMKVLQNLINLDLTWYKSNTENQFINVPISSSSGYSSMYAQAGNVQNTGMEIALGVNKTWNDFNWTSTLTYSYNKNKVIELLNNYNDQVTGEVYTVDQIRKGEIIIKPGGSMGDLYVTRAIKRDQNGNVWVDPTTNNVMVEQLKTPVKVGSVLPKGNLGFNNALNWKGVNMNILFTARLGGVVMSQTQAILDEYGVSKVSALARENGGFRVNNGTIDAEKYFSVVGGKNGDFSQYIYDATNVRLQELTIGYNLPARWFSNKLNVNLSFVARNLLMIYCKAPFDPELTASTGTYNQGIDYFMQPSQRNLGFNVKFQF